MAFKITILLFQTNTENFSTDSAGIARLIFPATKSLRISRHFDICIENFSQ